MASSTNKQQSATTETKKTMTGIERERERETTETKKTMTGINQGP